MSSDALTLFATWALAHEMADQEYRAAVRRGSDPGGEDDGLASLADRFVLLIDEEKERLKGRLTTVAEPTGLDLALEDTLAGVQFELAALRGRLETIESSLDAVLHKLS